MELFCLSIIICEVLENTVSNCFIHISNCTFLDNDWGEAVPETKLLDTSVHRAKGLLAQKSKRQPPSRGKVREISNSSACLPQVCKVWLYKYDCNTMHEYQLKIIYEMQTTLLYSMFWYSLCPSSL